MGQDVEGEAFNQVQILISDHPKGDKAGNVVERSLEKTVGE